MSSTVVRLIVLVALGLVAAAVAWRLQGRRPDPPSAPSYRAPTQLDMADFGLSGLSSSEPSDDTEPPQPSGAIVVFASELCSSCAGVWATVEETTPTTIATKLVNLEDDPDLHKRYRIDGVPTLVVVNNQGVVRNALFGPVTDDALTEALG